MSEERICKTCGKNESRLTKNGRMPCLSCSVPSILVQHGVYKKHAKASLQDFGSWVEKLIGKSLFIYGPTGTGKTHLAAALAREDILNHLFGNPEFTFASTQNLLNQIKATFEKNPIEKESEVLDFYSTTPNLFLDDLGVERPTDWVLSTLYTIIDRRYGEELRTVITSNLNLEELSDRLGQRLTSRIIGMCEITKLEGTDRRYDK